jgi:hypothetical protein
VAAVSYTIALSAVTAGSGLESVIAGTNAPSAGVVEIRMDQTTTTVNDANPLTGAATTRAPKKGEIQYLIRVLEEYLMRDTNVLEWTAIAGYTSSDPCSGVLLQGTTALQCKAGIIGGGAGAAYDTLLYGVYVQFGAGPPTLTIAGMLDSSGVAANLLVSGSTTLDYFWMPPAPIMNNHSAFVFTPSVAAKIWIFTRAYTGPEAPETRVTD